MSYHLKYTGNSYKSIKSKTFKKWVKDLNRNFYKENTQKANRYTKRYSLSLLIRKMQVKTIIYITLPVRMTIIKSQEIKFW